MSTGVVWYRNIALMIVIGNGGPVYDPLTYFILVFYEPSQLING